MSSSIIVIGAGIAGLSTGCYAQMNGYRTKILELHELPGGLCTSWKRKGYVFDGCLEWLVGSAPGNSLYRAWEELGALQGQTVVNHEEFIRVQGPDGKALVVYADIDRFERHLRELAPEDGDLIGEFARGVRLMTRFGLPLGKPRELYNLLDTIKMGAGMLPFLPTFMRYGKVSVQQFAARFKNPFLREAFAAYFDMPDFPLIAMMMALAWQHSRVAGYPIGGSLEFARAVERRFLDLGGEISYRSRVEKILVEGDRAVGVRLSGGSEQRAGIVISAADGHATLFGMLDGKYIDDRIRGYYRDWRPFQPIIQLSLGVNMDLSSQPHHVVHMLPDPIVIGGQEQRRVSFKHYCYDPTMAPAGKSVAISIIPAEYDYWQRLHADRAGYEAEKRRIAETVIGLLDARIPGIRSRVEVVDVASPITYERYTGNWRGSIEGWLPTTGNLTTQIGRSLPGLSNFYMVGQWVMPGGGLPTGAMTARETVQVICARDGRPFTTSKPVALPAGAAGTV